MRVLTLACFGAGLMLLIAPVASAASARVALLPIVVHSSTPDSDYLSAGLADMLAARLEMGGGIAVTRIATNARTTKRSVAIEAARNAKADYVVYGSFTQFGSGASLDVRCARVGESEEEDSGVRRVFIQSGSIGEIIPRLDALASKLRRFVNGQATQVSSVEEAEGSGARGLSDLRKRVDALERAVYVEGAAEVESNAGEAAPEARASEIGANGPSHAHQRLR